MDMINKDWLTPGYGGQHKFYIASTLMPLPPSEMTITIENRNEKLDLADGKVWKILNDPGLTQYEFELTLPGYEHSWTNAMWDTGFKEPYKYIKLFELLKTDARLQGRVFPFVVLRSGAYHGPELLQMCTLEDFTVKERAEDVGDFKVTLKLERYANEEGKKFALEQQEDGTYKIRPETPTHSGPPMAERITSIKLDSSTRLNTLYDIAAFYWGDGERYKELAELNGIDNPNELTEGMVIRLA